MTSVVNVSKCESCKNCVDVCPVDAFHLGPDAVVINPDTCIDCGVCIPECPQGAITTDSDAEEKWIKFNAEKSTEWPNASA